MRAIIIKKNLFDEGSEIVTFYTGEYGKLRAVARAVRFPKSRLAHGLQTLFYSEIEVAPGRKMPVITGAKAIHTFSNIRASLEKTYAAFFAIEVLLKATADQQPNPQLFDLFLDFLKHLNEASQTAVGAAAAHPCVDVFVLQLLDLSGYALTFERCISCLKKINSAKEEVCFSKRKSGFLCQSCAAKTADTELIPAALYQAIVAAKGSNYSAVDSFDQNRAALHNFASQFAAHILERNLNASQYLATLK